MGIGEHSGTRGFGSLLFTPDAGESQEEALLGSVSVDLLSFFPCLIIGDHVLERHQCDAGAAVIGGILAKGKTAVQLQVIDRHKVGVLVGNTTDALLKLLA